MPEPEAQPTFKPPKDAVASDPPADKAERKPAAKKRPKGFLEELDEFIFGAADDDEADEDSDDDDDDSDEDDAEGDDE